MKAVKTVDQYADLHPSGFDYLLTAISGGLTAYAAGMSVASPIAGWIFVVLSLLGIWISFAMMRAIRGTRIVAWNGFIYAAGVLAAFLLAGEMMPLIPENPFKGLIFVCGALLWMLAFGSFLIWSDQTLLFQAVPTIAIFGLVGCYDTFTYASWYFFGFLLCFAALLARVHGRTMLRQAKESGYSQTGERMDRSATELERMRSGPWKWVAGPQWALGSAFVVILFSVMGAPLIRQSVQGVAGVVKIQLPSTGRSSALPASVVTDASTMRVGSGPNAVFEKEVFRATLDEARFMRTNIFQTYTPQGWSALGNAAVGDKTTAVLNNSFDRPAIKAIKDPKTIPFEIEPIDDRMNVLPVPGELTRLEPEDGTTLRDDATVGIQNPGAINLFKGMSTVSETQGDPANAIRNLSPEYDALLSTANIRPSVLDLATRVAASGRNDYERATLIKHEIEKRVRYNLKAKEIPPGLDPVETFLFDTKEGYCDLFASAMVLMARSVGIPARMVIGYYPIHNEIDADGRYILKQTEKHAWAELLFEDHGWVAFDATEGAVAVPGGELGSSNVSTFAQSGILNIALDVAIGLAAVALLYFTFRSFFKGMRLGPSRSDLDKTYLRFADILARASGKPRNFDQTASEYVREAAANLNGATEQALAINAQFERMFYSQQAPTREGLAKLRNDISALKAKVKTSPSKVA